MTTDGEPTTESNGTASVIFNPKTGARNVSGRVFFEDDEPIEKIRRIFDEGDKGTTEEPT